MPRKRSQSAAVPLIAPAAPDLIDGVPVPVLEKRIAEIRRCKQAQGDANTAHATAWKALEEAGVASNQGWKWAIKLERMEETKRAAVLASFDAARRYLNLDAQLALDLQPEERAPAETSPATEGAAAAPMDGEDAAGDRDPDQGGEPSSEWEDALPPSEDPALDRGGAYYAEGRSAGLDGLDLDAKPYPADSVPGGLWEAGLREGKRLRTAPPPLGTDRPAFPDAAA